MKRIKLFAAAAALMMAMPGANAQVLTYLDPELPREQRIEDLLSRLTLEEKVGMMMNSSKPVERLGIPAYDWWNEALHGVARAGLATVYPQAKGQPHGKKGENGQRDNASDKELKELESLERKEGAHRPEVCDRYQARCR